ncbi:MAG: cysteine--tRNA ligase [Candidatus Woesearchaeota archaeon]
MFQIFNTLTRKKENFKPVGEVVRMYNCGPTVYDYPHIGNYRAYVFADILKRYLKYKGYKVKQVQNITDVDDKTIRGSQKEGISLKQFTKKYELAFYEDIEKLNIDKADIFPKATEHINEMVSIIKLLLKKNIAYKSEDGSIYYDISKFKDYGQLAHINVSQLKGGARVKQDEYEKEEVHDFALWKAWDKDDGDVFWETELGKGRPGWHIECSAMSMKHLTEAFNDKGDINPNKFQTIDIHTGGVDNIFPHHENEIAQTEGAVGKKFVNFWVHCEHLLVDNRKMSKSLGNFYTFRDVIKKGYNPGAVRYLLLATHYRQQLNFSFRALESAEEAVNRINNFVYSLKIHEKGEENSVVESLIKNTKENFEKNMDNDLNISPALAAIFEFIKEINNAMQDKKLSKRQAQQCIDLVMEFDKVLGVVKEKSLEIPEEAKKLIKEREEARKAKDWKKADELRIKLKEMGIQLIDTAEGTKWMLI